MRRGRARAIDFFAMTLALAAVAAYGVALLLHTLWARGDDEWTWWR